MFRRPAAFTVPTFPVAEVPPLDAGDAAALAAPAPAAVPTAAVPGSDASAPGVVDPTGPLVAAPPVPVGVPPGAAAPGLSPSSSPIREMATPLARSTIRADAKASQTYALLRCGSANRVLPKIPSCCAPGERNTGPARPSLRCT